MRAPLTRRSGQDAAPTFAKLQTPVKQSLESLNNALKQSHKASTTFQKALDKKLRVKPIATDDNALLADYLLDYAVGMHLTRDGEFGVVTEFMNEIPWKDITSAPAGNQDYGALQTEFQEMYYILREMRSRHNLTPAMNWAREQSDALQARGSDLEFQLTKLMFISILLGVNNESASPTQRLLKAMMYAREALDRFEGRYIRTIQLLLGTVAFSANLEQSPYGNLDDYSPLAWEEVAVLFAQEYCSSIGLSAASPLSLAVTAGAIALPVLGKLAAITRLRRTEWTTSNEIPVEISLPPGFMHHPLVVCPVSKEVTTPNNPPMLLPCYHVVAKDSLARISKLGKYRCPYCPQEGQYNQAKRVYLD